MLNCGKSAGQTGPVTDTSTQEYQDGEAYGNKLMSESSEAWANLYSINTFPIYFVTAAFLGLLEKGSRDMQDLTSCVINITSISGVIKVAQNHVSKQP